MKESFAVLLAVAAMASGAGCSAGHVLGEGEYEFEHPAVRWAYVPGRQLVSTWFVPHMLRNNVRELQVDGGRIFVQEAGPGGETKALWEPWVELDAQTGQPSSASCRPSQECPLENYARFSLGQPEEGAGWTLFEVGAIRPVRLSSDGRTLYSVVPPYEKEHRNALLTVKDEQRDFGWPRRVEVAADGAWLISLDRAVVCIEPALLKLSATQPD